MNTASGISLIEAIINADLHPPDTITIDGAIHRFASNGDKSDLSGFYAVWDHADFLAGHFGCFRADIRQNWTSRAEAELTPEQRREYRERIEKAKAEAERIRKAEAEQTAIEAKKLWDQAKPALPDHPYLINKQVKAHGIRQGDNVLLIPVMDIAGNIKSIQRIYPDGGKFFLKGGATRGGFFRIPGDEATTFICEGYATGATISEITGNAVIIAFNAGNLKPVAEAIAKHYPSNKIVIAADYDRKTPENPGLTKGREAAEAIGAGLVWPEFGEHEQGSDFNDLAALHGPEAVKERLSATDHQDQAGSKSFSEFQTIIDLKDGEHDAEFLTVELVEEIYKSGLAKPLVEKLLKAIAKKCGIKISLLHQQKQNEKTVSQIDMVLEIADAIGRDDVLFTMESIWRWKDSGVWQALDDREAKTWIQDKLKDHREAISQNVVNSMLDLFKTEVYRPGHRFDVNRDSINCLNGELIWTGDAWELTPHKKESYRTTQIPVAYDPGATAPMFERFLFSSFEPDQDKADKAILICEFIGYCLLSNTKYEKFFILIGPGANGKSVLLIVMVALLGPDNVAAISPLQFENKFQRAHLLGKLANIVTELPEGAVLPDAAMKSITSGDPMTAEAKFKPPFTFEPFSTIAIATNHLPHTRDFSPALFRRCIPISFNRVFQEHEQDKTLADKLKSELPGILNLALEAMAGVFRRGYFSETESTRELKNQWRLEADQAAQFLIDCCIPEPGHRETSKVLYTAYRQWATDQGINKMLNQNNFTKRLKILGACDVRGHGGKRMLAGFQLRNDY